MLEKLPASVGRALRGLRADLADLTFNDPELSDVTEALSIASPAFRHGQPMPARYTADGEGCSPPLAWSGVPEAAASIALVVEDADSPTARPLVHAIVWALPPEDRGLAEGALPRSGDAQVAAPMGRNSYWSAGYLPPDPPSGHGPHRYAFQLFALDARPGFDAVPGRTRMLECLRRHAIAKGVLVGVYERH